MPVDPKGTTPGLANQAAANKPVNMKCRNPKCDCISATAIPVKNLSQKVFRCTECGYVWSISIGGSIDL